MHSDDFHVVALGNNHSVRPGKTIARHPDRRRVALDDRSINRPEAHPAQRDHACPLQTLAVDPGKRRAGIHQSFKLFRLVRRGRIPEAQLGFEAAHLYATFSTCPNSNSTGVERPKIVTMTFRVSRSSFTSSTTPVNVANGPSLIRTVSFFSNLTLSFGFSRLSATL